MSQNEIDASGHPLRNVSLRISQVFSACTFCKARKIKCNGVPPACGGCIKFGRQATCSLSYDTSNRGRDYPTYLRQKISKAQQRLEQLRSEQNTLISPAPHAEPSTRTEPTESHYNPIVDSLIADIGALPIIACSCPPEAEGPTISSLVLATAGTDQLSSILHSTQSNEDTPFLPKESTALTLCKHYFTNVYPRIPFFSIQGFWIQFEYVFSGVDPRDARNPHIAQNPASVPSRNSDDFNQSSISHGYSYFTVLLVLAISASSISRNADSVISTQAHRLFRTALTFRESAIVPNTIVGIQSVLFLVQFATLNPSLLDAWYLIGVGMRMCVDLGLHQDPKPLDSVTSSLLETRRRLWWSMYSFDRSMSLGRGRPTEISDSAISVSLPTFRIETSATTVEVHGYLQRYRALQIQSEIYNCLNKSPGPNQNTTQTVFTELCKKLTQWKHASSQLPNKTLIESEWLMGRMLLMRPCKFLPERTNEELHELWNSAVGFIRLYRQLVESNSIFYVELACEKVNWTGLMALHSYWKLHVSTTAECVNLRAQDVWILVKNVMFILQILGERWEHGKLLSTSFDKISTRMLELSAGIPSERVAAALPMELRNLEQYTSLTVVWASVKNGPGQINMDCQNANNLRKLVSEML